MAAKKFLPLRVVGLGQVTDALSGRTADGIIVHFGDGPARALSWGSFRQLLKMELADPEAPNGWASTATPEPTPAA